jgi:hypothetical protein
MVSIRTDRVSDGIPRVLSQRILQDTVSAAELQQ